ncbi:hypothetical protein ACIA5C_47790 [Actinoplanes sp. NPDC051343]|uniref:hypothetical protein n=1 Tax=Actinoplanes sp. NPDC051343 TaxID=3363906 RepID=UPI0037AD1119
MDIRGFNSRLSDLLAELKIQHLKDLPLNLIGGALIGSSGGDIEKRAIALALDASMPGSAMDVIETAMGTRRLGPQDYQLRLAAVIHELVKRKKTDLPKSIEVVGPGLIGGGRVEVTALTLCLQSGTVLNVDEIIFAAKAIG